MFKYVELCVDMRRGRFAKDGLIQYRIVCQQVNINSLEEVIKHFMHLATERAELARNQAQALEEALDVEDLEADKRPEDLMLSYVSGEKGKDRSDRELVTPWFKFLWETYRTVLEILRNNSKLEALYAVSTPFPIFVCLFFSSSSRIGGSTSAWTLTHFVIDDHVFMSSNEGFEYPDFSVSCLDSKLLSKLFQCY